MPPKNCNSSYHHESRWKHVSLCWGGSQVLMIHYNCIVVNLRDRAVYSSCLFRNSAASLNSSLPTHIRSICKPNISRICPCVGWANNLCETYPHASAYEEDGSGGLAPRNSAEVGFPHQKPLCRLTNGEYVPAKPPLCNFQTRFPSTVRYRTSWRPDISVGAMIIDYLHQLQDLGVWA